MRKLFSANKYLAFTLALAGFAAAGMAPAFGPSPQALCGSCTLYYGEADARPSVKYAVDQ